MPKSKGRLSPSPPESSPKRQASARTVGRGRTVQLEHPPASGVYSRDGVHLQLADALTCYRDWTTPTVIVSDGGYGVLGFDGDTSDHLDLPEWYEPHVRSWSMFATPATTLWFWNSEIGWAAVHPTLQRYGWRYQNCNIWNKTCAHIAGNVNTQKIRRFPVVTEVCVQYTLEAFVDEMPLKVWLLSEWRRSGLPLRKANEACGVRDAAVRKYFTQGHLWYFPPPEMFEKLQVYANTHGLPEGRPYFAIDGQSPATAAAWASMRAKFSCPHGWTNVWERGPLNDHERIRVNGRAVHLNQKPLDLMRLIIEASSDEGDVVWEPFGGLFSASLAARSLHRQAFSAETDSTYFQYGVQRFSP